MAQEIEKKYLIFKDKLPALKNGILYIQGYLSISPLIRFRIIKNEVCINIKKIKKDIHVREEWEFYNNLTLPEIKKLIQLSISKPVKKFRYKIKYKDLIWEVDVYQEKNIGLVTAEVELPNKKHKIIFPEWVDSKREISNDKRYFNRNLGNHPFKLSKK